MTSTTSDCNVTLEGIEQVNMLAEEIVGKGEKDDNSKCVSGCTGVLRACNANNIVDGETKRIEMQCSASGNTTASEQRGGKITHIAKPLRGRFAALAAVAVSMWTPGVEGFNMVIQVKRAHDRKVREKMAITTNKTALAHLEKSLTRPCEVCDETKCSSTEKTDETTMQLLLQMAQIAIDSCQEGELNVGALGAESIGKKTGEHLSKLTEKALIALLKVPPEELGYPGTYVKEAQKRAMRPMMESAKIAALKAVNGYWIEWKEGKKENMHKFIEAVYKNTTFTPAIAVLVAEMEKYLGANAVKKMRDCDAQASSWCEGAFQGVFQSVRDLYSCDRK